MQTYVAQRVLLLIPTMLGITIFVYAGVRLLPGDIVDQVLEGAQISPEERRELERSYNIDAPIVQGYFQWIGDMARGDFGRSLVSRGPVSEEITARFPVTLELGLLAMMIAIAMALPIGAIAAIKQDSWYDYAARSLAIGLLAVPSFWLALLTITYGFAWFGWVPPLRYAELWEQPWDNIKLMIAPAIILGGALSGSLMRFTRSAVLDVMRQDYVRTARAKGLREHSVVIRHVVRNALLPVVTIIGLRSSVIFGGTVILEQIFSLPGLGSYLLQAIQQRDYPVVQAIVVVTAIAVVFTNLLVDLTYGIIDPRVRYS